MFRIIRNEAGDEKEELTGYWPAEALVLTGEKKKNKNKNTTNMENNFLTSCVGSFLAKFYTSPQIKGYREIFSSQTIQLLSYLGVLLLSRISLPTRRTLLKVH